MRPGNNSGILKRARLLPILVLCIAPTAIPGTVYSQQFKVSGVISDSLSNETLIGATIYNVSDSTGTISADSGKYSIKIKKGPCLLKFSYIGYAVKTITFFAEGNLRMDIKLSPVATQSQAAIVTAGNPAESTENARTGVVRLSRDDLGSVPQLLGEPDLIRALNYSPGVQSSGDGNSGFYVRGGNVDQNLILMDNAVIYNPSHVLGFFSVFNPDLVSNATLVKSGIPANYGGRISSVLTVKTIDGDFNSHHITGNVGLLYSRLTVHGPIVKDRISYLISFRKSYVNEILKPVIGVFRNSDSSQFLDGSSYGMYDLNLKISGILSKRNRLSIMYYKGRDNFELERSDMDFKTLMNWGNNLIALNWNYIPTDSSYILNSLNYSNYDFSYNASQFIMDFDLYSSIRSFNYRLEYNTVTKRLGSVKTGLEAKYYNFVPNRFMLTINETDLNYSNYQDMFAGEFAFFFSCEKDISRRLRISAGLRATNYRHLGPYKLINRSDELTSDTLAYGRMQTIKSYSGFEPRISLRYQLSTESSVKASYTRNYQFIHIASASSVTLPSDIWIPSTSSTPPQYGDQYTFGYYRNFNDGMFTSSAEFYYKSLFNQVELLYGLGASLQDVSFENSLTGGTGYATGAEFYICKNEGLLTGSLAYSLAYTERQFNEINNGKPFPAKYDRRHELSITAAYNPGDRWEFSASFIYATGNAMTVPVQIYLFDNNINTEYSETNAFRMPPYHRLDLSATYMLKKTGRFESSLNFSVMNVYNRANPFLIFFDIEGDILTEHSLSVSAKQISIFPVLPSVSWNFKF